MTILENSLEAFIFVNLQKGSVLPPLSSTGPRRCVLPASSWLLLLSCTPWLLAAHFRLHTTKFFPFQSKTMQVCLGTANSAPRAKQARMFGPVGRAVSVPPPENLNRCKWGKCSSQPDVKGEMGAQPFQQWSHWESHEKNPNYPRSHLSPTARGKAPS